MQDTITINGNEYSVVSSETTDEVMAKFPNTGRLMAKTGKTARMILQKPNGFRFYEVYQFTGGQFGKIAKVA